MLAFEWVIVHGHKCFHLLAIYIILQNSTDDYKPLINIYINFPIFILLNFEIALREKIKDVNSLKLLQFFVLHTIRKKHS
jgi:hypothetical protein